MYFPVLFFVLENGSFLISFLQIKLNSLLLGLNSYLTLGQGAALGGEYGTRGPGAERPASPWGPPQDLQAGGVWLALSGWPP